MSRATARRAKAKPTTVAQRQIAGVERRTFTFERLELRQAEDGSPILDGYAAVFGKRSENLGGFYETLEQGAFCNVLSNDCRLLINHDGIPLARTASGTLTLTEDAAGLHFEAPVDESRSDVQALTSALRRGDINQCSFGFMVASGGAAWTRTADGELRTIKRGGISRLLDVSVVTFPAYPDTSADVRGLGMGERPAELTPAERASRMAELRHELRHKHAKSLRSLRRMWRKEQRAKRAASGDQIPAMGYDGDPPEGSLEDWIDDLNGLLTPSVLGVTDADPFWGAAFTLATFGVNGPGFCVAIVLLDWWEGTVGGFFKQPFVMDPDTAEPMLDGEPVQLELLWQPATEGGEGELETDLSETGTAAPADPMMEMNRLRLDLQRRRVA